MKQQTTALVLCALLFTTFGHELLNRQYEAQASRIGHSPFRSHHLQNRQLDDDSGSGSSNETYDQCVAKCNKTAPVTEPTVPDSPPTEPTVPDSPPTEPTVPNSPPTDPTVPDNPGNGNVTGCVHANLTVIINVTTNIVVVINETARVAVVFDLNTQLVLLVNVTAQIVIRIDYARGTGVYYENVQFKAGVSLEALLVGITSLTDISVIVGTATGTNFSITSITAKISLQITLILVSLGYQANGRSETALAIIINISLSISASLKVVGQSITSGRSQNSTDLAQLVGRLQVIASIIVEIRANVKLSLDLNAILSATNGVDVLIYIIGVIVASGNQQEVQTCLQSSSHFFLLLSLLSANSSNSYSAFLTVIARIDALANNNASIEVIIQVLIDYYISQPSGSNIQVQLNATIGALIDVLVQANLTQTEVYQTLQGIQNGTWVVNRINISAIITILVEVSGATALDAIVRIIVLVAAVISIEISITTLILVILRLLIVQGGIQILLVLIPSLITILTGNIIAIIGGILRGLNLLRLLTGDWYGLLAGLPLFGDIFVAINVSLKAATNGQLTVSVCVKAQGSASIIVQIRAVLRLIIQFYLGISVGVSINREHLVHEKHHLTHERHHLVNEKELHHHGHLNEKHHEKQHERHHGGNLHERQQEAHLHEKQHQKNQHEKQHERHHNQHEHERHHGVSHGQEKHHEEVKHHQH